MTAWKGLVGEDVEVEYFRDRVEQVKSDDEDDKDKEENEEANAVESDGESDADWESWILDQCPKAASEMRRPTRGYLTQKDRGVIVSGCSFQLFCLAGDRPPCLVEQHPERLTPVPNVHQPHLRV